MLREVDAAAVQMPCHCWPIGQLGAHAMAPSSRLARAGATSWLRAPEWRPSAKLAQAGRHSLPSWPPGAVRTWTRRTRWATAWKAWRAGRSAPA